MGLPMSGNLVKKGFDVKAFDINPKTLEKCAEFVYFSFKLFMYYAYRVSSHQAQSEKQQKM